MKTKQELVNQLRATAHALDSVANFEFENEFAIIKEVGIELTFYDKDKFVAAVKALGNVTKRYTEGEYAELIVETITFPKIKLRISRDKVCTKTVVYDCEALFSTEEVEAL